MPDPVINRKSNLPLDDRRRNITVSQPDVDQSLRHIGLVGDTYTITVSGEDTNGRLCVIDMYIPPGGGPAPHRHDFEETFVVLEGQIEATFRGQIRLLEAGTTANIPSNAPHRFHNASSKPARLLCICSPAGLDEFFQRIGVPVATRTTAPPELTEEQQRGFIAKAKALAPEYHTELLAEA